MTTLLSTHLVTPVQRQQFHDEGYFILDRVVPEPHLELLRSRVMSRIALADAEMERQGVAKLGLNHRGSRYFVSAYTDGAKELGEFLFSDLMAAVTRATLGDNVYLFFEQYVVKAAEKGGQFSWHQDSGYVGHPHRPYLTCWIPLDDVSEANGTAYLLPYSRAGTRAMVEHHEDEALGDLIGYTGPDPGLPVIAPAGSIACFSSTVFHRSGPNTTDQMRRIYLAQYSAEPLLLPDGSGPWGLAEPLLRDGERVRFGAH